MEILAVAGFKEDVLLLVVNNTEYRVRVPMLLGMLHIDMILEKSYIGRIKEFTSSLEKRYCG